MSNLPGMISTEQMRNASPSALDSYREDVEKAVMVLREEADSADSEWVEENLSGAAEYLENEVL